MPFLKIEFPFTIWLGKNNTRGFARGHYYIKREAKQASDALIMAIKAANKGQKWNDKEKIWLNLFVEKSKERIDCINFLDTIADCLKKGLECDDKVFCVSQLDYEIKKDGVIRIIVEQE